MAQTLLSYYSYYKGERRRNGQASGYQPRMAGIGDWVFLQVHINTVYLVSCPLENQIPSGLANRTHRSTIGWNSGKRSGIQRG